MTSASQDFAIAASDPGVESPQPDLPEIDVPQTDVPQPEIDPAGSPEEAPELSMACVTA